MKVSLAQSGAWSLAAIAVLISSVSAEVFEKLRAVPEGKITDEHVSLSTSRSESQRILL